MTRGGPETVSTRIRLLPPARLVHRRVRGSGGHCTLASTCAMMVDAIARYGDKEGLQWTERIFGHSRKTY
jgi:hypothetical protein